MNSFQKDQSHKGSVVYEQVIHKNFQVMQTFLKRFHQIFTKQDQFQENLLKIAEKLTQHQQTMQQLKENQRFGILMIQKKITNLKNSALQSKRMSRSSRMGFNINLNQQQIIPNQQKQIITQLKFDSITKSLDDTQKVKTVGKQQIQKQNVIIKQFNQYIESLKKDVMSLKDKTTFLSNYTSILSDKIDAQDSNNMKPSLLANIQNTILKKQQNNMKTKFNQKQNQLLEFITSQLDHINKKINQKIDEDFSKNDKKINAKIQSFLKKDIFDKEMYETKQKMTTLAEQCYQIFSKKQQTKKYMQMIDKKIIKLQAFLNYSNDQFNQKNRQMHSGVQSPFISQHNSRSKLRKSKIDCTNRFNRRNSLKNIQEGQYITQLKKTNSSKQQKRKIIDFSSQYLLAHHVSKQFTKDLGYSVKKLNKSSLMKNKSIQAQTPLCKSTILSQIQEK